MKNVWSIGELSAEVGASKDDVKIAADRLGLEPQRADGRHIYVADADTVDELRVELDGMDDGDDLDDGDDFDDGSEFDADSDED